MKRVRIRLKPNAVPAKFDFKEKSKKPVRKISNYKLKRDAEEDERLKLIEAKRIIPLEHDYHKDVGRYDKPKENRVHEHHKDIKVQAIEIAKDKDHVPKPIRFAMPEEESEGATLEKTDLDQNLNENKEMEENIENSDESIDCVFNECIDEYSDIEDFLSSECLKDHEGVVNVQENKNVKEHDIKETFHDNQISDLVKTLRDKEKKNDQLEMELAEKNREIESFKKQMENLKSFLNKDQIHRVTKKGAGKSWSNETVTESLKIRHACGKFGYEYLRGKGYPLPNIVILEDRVHALQIPGEVLKECTDLNRNALLQDLHSDHEDDY